MDAKRFIWPLLTPIWVVLYLIPLPEPLAPAVALLGITLLPGLNAGLLLSGGRGWAALAIGFCLAPLFAGTAFFPLAPSLLTVPLAIAAAFLPRKEEDDPGLKKAFAISLLLVGVTAYLLLFSVRLRLSSHGLLHSAVAYQVIDTGLPPENPFFAGQPLIYYWYYHLAAARLSLASAFSPLFAFAVMNLFAVAALAPCLYLIGRALRLSTWTALLGAAIALLALNPLGPLFYLLQEPEFALADVAQGAAPSRLVSSMVLQGVFDLRLGSSLTKFWNVSSFPVAVPLFLLGLFAALSPVSWRTFLLLFITTSGLMLINPLVGICFIVPLGLAATAWLIRGAWRRYVTCGIALTLGAAVSVPYLLSITQGAEGGSFLKIGFALPPLMGLVLAAGPVLLFTLFGARRLLKQGENDAWLPVLVILCLAGMSLALFLPMDNQYKLVRLLLLPAGVLAAPAVVIFLQRLRFPRVVSLLMIAAALLPNTLLALTAYLFAMQADLPVDDRDVQISFTGTSAEVYRILRNEPDAVVVVDPKDRWNAVGGKMQGDEVPAFTRKPLYTGHRFYLTDRSPGFEDRITRTASLFLGQEASLPEPVDGRPLFVLVRSEEIPPALKTAAFEEVFRDKNAALFRFIPESR